jgi:glycosyltransferase involved in cell wall biosynthesis
VAVEALAAGAPVIAYKAGGALDYIKSGQTGLFFEPQTTEALQKALKKFNSMNFDHNSIAKSAQGFDAEHFKVKISDFIKRSLKTAN